MMSGSEDVSRLGAPGGEVGIAAEDEIYQWILAGEGILVLRRLARGCFRVVGTPPAWVDRVAPGALAPGAETDVSEVFLFLAHFLEDAEMVWESGGEKSLTSDVWTQAFQDGPDQPFTATARLVGREAYLLIRALGVDFEERRRVLQKARELALAHERLLKEISKKEALLHCLVHDVGGPATAISNCFELLGMEPGLSADSRDLVRLGFSEVKRQQVLLRGTLDIFAAELSALEAFSSEESTAPDALRCIRSVQKQLNAGLVAKGVSIAVEADRELGATVKVTGNAEKLERVLYNLLENAIRHTPVGSTVTIRVMDEENSVQIAVDDEGDGVEPGMAGKLFGRFRQGPRDSGKAGIGLFFCQMMIKRWGGEIGCMTRESGGSRFWFRLPKPGAAALVVS